MRIKQLFYPLATRQGYYADYVIDAFINGYQPVSPADRRFGYVTPPEQYKPYAQGGYFYPVFKSNRLTHRVMDTGRVTYDEMSRELKDLLTSGHGICATHSTAMAVKHAVTLWGAEYDEQGKLTAVYLTDSDDYGHYIDDKPRGMVRYDVYRGTYGQPIVTTMKNQS